MNEGTLYLLILGALALSLLAQVLVNSRFERYRKVPTASGLTGGEVARRLLDDAGLRNVRIERVSGRLTDHYDPQAKVLRLSPETMDGANVAALGVAAHETGHALQDADAYAPLQLRTACVRTAGIGSQAAWPLFLAGLIFNFRPLVLIGIALYAAMVVFTLVTLPVELNASHRALTLLENGGYLTSDEMPGARSVLSAAALTYVASALMAVLQLLRLIAIAGNRHRRD